MYFTVNEANGSDAHIGTICAGTSEQLTEKVKTALKEHLDADVQIPKLNIEDYLYGKDGTVPVTSDSDFSPQIFITETWLY